MHAETLVSAASAAEVMPTGQLVQDEADCAEYLPTAHGVHADGLLPEKPAALAKPPLAAYEPAAHAPAHAAVV